MQWVKGSCEYEMLAIEPECDYDDEGNCLRYEEKCVGNYCGLKDEYNTDCKNCEKKEG